MVYLQDADNASRLATLDRSGVHLRSLAWSRVLKMTTAREVSGHLGMIATKPAAVYVAGGRLWLAVDGRPWFLDELHAEIDRVDSGYRVRISTPERDYGTLIDGSLFDDADVTPLAAPEDFSFELWTAHIIKSPERQKVLQDVLVNASMNEVPAHAPNAANDMRASWTQTAQMTDRDSSRKRST